MITYCVSDIHSTISKFKKSKPRDAKHIIINGDLFNKSVEQEETLFWLLENYNNPRYTFIFGNHEVRFFNELYRILKSGKLETGGLYDAWFESDNPFNIANVAKRLIDDGKLDPDFLFKKVLPVFKWYHIVKPYKTTYIIAHASWEINKKPEQQNRKNLIYDTIRFFNQIRKINNPVLDKYAQKCLKNNIRHVFGHYVCWKVFKTDAPYISRQVFYFIDNGVFKKAHNYYFMPLL